MGRLSKRQIGVMRKTALRGTLTAIGNYLAWLIVFTTPKEKEIKDSVKNSEAGGEPYLILPAVETNAALGVILPIFQNAVKSGEARAAKLSGQMLTPDFIDHASIAELSNHQLNYIKNLQKAQQEKFTQILIEGQEKGLSLQKVTDNAVAEISGLTRQRAQLIAKTEVIKAHSAGMMNTLKFNNVERYQWSTRPLRIPDVSAPLDRAMDGRIYFVDAPPPPFNIDPRNPDPSAYDPFAPLPVQNTHPNCTCIIVVP